MAFHFEGNVNTVASINNACIFPRPLHDAIAGGGQGAKQVFAVFVATVFAPKGGKHDQFGKVGLAVECFHNQLVFARA